jgi:alpha-L-glutamate ligase-like protein
MTALGINARNSVIARRNPRRAIVDAKDKSVTKRRLAANGIPVPETLCEIHDRRELRRFDESALPDQWVVKPSRGSGGRGVMVVVGALRSQRAWATPGRVVSSKELQRHLAGILGGDHSTGDDDVALFEPLLQADPEVALLTRAGLPDIRVVCDGTTPLLAMARIPTVASGGRGNLHQGGIGAAIDLQNGRITRAVHQRRPIDVHPDTNRRLVGIELPRWDDVLDIARRCGQATGLGYLGVDIVVDATRGPLVLEVNSHPGLEIQNVAAMPLVPSRRRQRREVQSADYDAPVLVR